MSRTYTPGEVRRVIGLYRQGKGVNAIDAACPGIYVQAVIRRYATESDRAEHERNIAPAKRRSGRPRRVYDEATMSTLRTMYASGASRREIQDALPGVAVSRLIQATFDDDDKRAHDEAVAARLGRSAPAANGRGGNTPEQNRRRRVRRAWERDPSMSLEAVAERVGATRAEVLSSLVPRVHGWDSMPAEARWSAVSEHAEWAPRDVTRMVGDPLGWLGANDGGSMRLDAAAERVGLSTDELLDVIRPPDPGFNGLLPVYLARAVLERAPWLSDASVAVAADCSFADAVRARS